MIVLLVNAPWVLSADDGSTICTNDGNCYTLCSQKTSCELMGVDALCITYWGRQDLNEVTNSCISDVTHQCYLCYGPPTTE